MFFYILFSPDRSVPGVRLSISKGYDGMTADLYLYMTLVSVGNFPQIVFYDPEKFFVYPVKNKAVGREQAYIIILFNGLQGPDPGIELLGWQFSFQSLKARLPY